MYREDNHYKLEKSRPILCLSCLRQSLLYEIWRWRYTMTKPKMKAKTKPLSGFENCRVVEVGIGNFAECAQWGPVNCPHALAFGYCFLCMHPRVDEIIEHSKKAQPFAGVPS